MKILFICRANVERSRFAALYYNSMTGTKDASSAGTSINELDLKDKTIERISVEKNKKIDPPSVKISIKTMKKNGFDTSDSKPIQLTKEMTDRADKLISFVDKEALPSYVDMKKVIFWKVDDQSNCSYKSHLGAIEEIRRLVNNFIKNGK